MSKDEYDNMLSLCSLCPAYGSGAVGHCKHGAQCVDAHGVEELNEWKERFEYRMMKLQRANEALLYGKSYTELLLNRYEFV